MVSRIGPVTSVTQIATISGTYVYRSPFIRAIDTSGISLTAADPALPATLASPWPMAGSSTRPRPGTPQSSSAPRPPACSPRERTTACSSAWEPSPARRQRRDRQRHGHLRPGAPLRDRPAPRPGRLPPPRRRAVPRRGRALSVLGGLAGTVLGLLATAIYALTQHWSVLIPALALYGGAGAALAIGAIAGLHPAMRAARLSPTERCARYDRPPVRSPPGLPAVAGTPAAQGTCRDAATASEPAAVLSAAAAQRPGSSRAWPGMRTYARSQDTPAATNAVGSARCISHHPGLDRGQLQGSGAGERRGPAGLSRLRSPRYGRTRISSSTTSARWKTRPRSSRRGTVARSGWCSAINWCFAIKTTGGVSLLEGYAFMTYLVHPPLSLDERRRAEQDSPRDGTASSCPRPRWSSASK